METGIYEAFVMTDRQLDDATVVAALERLIEQLRQRSLPPPPPDGESADVTDDEDLVLFNIRRQWRDLADSSHRYTRDDLVGILRTILGSIEVWTSRAEHSQGYLHYIEGLLKGAGVSVRMLDRRMRPIPEPEDDPLLTLVRAWYAGDRDAEAGFRDEARRLIGAGEAERVIRACQQLIGETQDEAFLPHLKPILLLAHAAS